MPDLPTRSDYFNVFLREVLARAATRSTGKQITVDQVTNPGSDINLIAVGTSAMAEEVTRQLARSTRALTLDGAQGAELDRWASDRYGTAVPRKQATPARVLLTLRRTSGGGGVTYPSGSRVATPGGVLFTLLADAPFTAGSNGPVRVNARAVNAGTAGNVATGTITRFITPPPDSTMSVSNETPPGATTGAASGGDATETDSAYRERIRRFFLTLPKGTLPAIEFGALTVPGIRQATAVEETTITGGLSGRVFLYLADANGQANATVVEEVRVALLEYRCGGVQVVIVGGTPTYVTIQYHLRFATNVDTAAAFESVRATTLARVNQLAPQETLPVSMLFEIARSVPGVVVLQDAVALPAGDVVPPDGSGQVIRTRTDLISNA